MPVKTKEKPHIKTLNLKDESTPQRIPMREYIRNYKKYNDMVNETREPIIITNQDDDTIMLTPIKKKRLWTFEEIRKELSFKGGKNLSKNIDKIVYGI